MTFPTKPNFNKLAQAECRVTARSVYGQTNIYPANDVADGLAAIAGTKTLTARTLRIARDMGFVLVVDGDATIDALLGECR